MAQHLTIQEKNNAEIKHNTNKLLIKELISERQELKYKSQRKNSTTNYLGQINTITEQINLIKQENKRLKTYLCGKKRSKYDGKFAERGKLNEMFGKKYKELLPEQKREYNRLKRNERYQKHKKQKSDL
jgi:hypothetical protein